MADSSIRRESVEYLSLKKYESELIESLQDVNLVFLARQAAECGLVSGDMETKLDTLHPKIPHHLACRYLFYNVYRSLMSPEKPGVDSYRSYNFWLSILSRWAATASVVSLVSQCHQEFVDILLPWKSSPRQEASFLFTLNHVPLLTEVLAECCFRWKEIAYSLWLPDTEIKRILATVQIHSNVMRFKEILSAWVMYKYPGAKAPTLANLEAALYSKMVSLERAASQLRENLVKKLSTVDHPVISELQHIQKLQICSQTRHVRTTEGYSVLLAVQATTPSNRPTSFEWFKDKDSISSTSQSVNSYNNYHETILFQHVEDLHAEGAYTCCVTHHDSTLGGDTVVSDPIMVTVTTPLDKYHKQLTDFHIEQPEVPTPTWSPNSKENYVSLALIKQDSIHHGGAYGYSTLRGDTDDIYNSKESVSYEKVFHSLDNGARLLIEGRPGSGKTTLMHKVNKDWATEAIQYKCVRLLFLVHLRAFCSGPHVELSDIISCYFQMPSEKQEMLEYAEKHRGLGFCFILDGLDEYLPSDTEKPFVFKLIQGKALPRAIVIVASRPAAAARFRSAADRRVEVLGFLNEQVSDYINDYPFSKSKSEDLHFYLVQHPYFQRMCYLPIHAAMVCFLFDRLDKNLPQTETEMYKEFTKFIILRILYHDEQPDIYKDSIEILAGSRRQAYFNLCKLAYEMCVASKQVMPQSVYHAPDGKDSLGLIVIDEVAARYGLQKMYSFLHLTFQEFLAAYYIASLDEERQVQVIQEFGKVRQMRQVWKFFCGLVKFDPDCRRLITIIGSENYGGLFGIQCAFESQQPHVCDCIVKDNCLSFNDSFLSQSSFTEIAFVLSNSIGNPVLRLSFDGCVFEQESVDILVKKAGSKLSAFSTLWYFQDDTKQLIQHFFQSLPSLEVLVVSDSLYFEAGLDYLTKHFASSNLKIVKVAFMEGLSSSPQSKNSITLGDIFTPNCWSFNIYLDGSMSEAHPNFNSGFREFGIHGMNLTSVGLKALSLDFVRNSFFVRLTFTNCGIDNDSATCLASGIKCCRDLEVLELGFNNIGDRGAMAIANSVKLTPDLILLDLTCNKLTNVGALQLADTFEGGNVRILLGFNDITNHDDIFQKCSCIEFHTLNFSKSNLGDGGASWLNTAIASCDGSDILQVALPMNSLSSIGMKSLASILMRCDNLLILDLCSNALGEEGAIALGGVLKHCTKLSELDVSSNLIGSKGATAIAESLASCTSLLKLKIGGNNIRCEGLQILAECLKDCSIFQELRIDSNGIQNSGAKALATVMSLGYWTNFFVLDINSNGISSEGVNALAEGLAECTSLKELYINNNNLQSDDAEYLAFALKKFSNFQCLDISSNDLQSSGAKIIADVLLDRKSLRVFNISNNNIGKHGAQSIATSLKHWTRISYLNVSSNSAKSSGTRSVLQALLPSSSGSELSFLDISGNSILNLSDKTAVTSLKHLVNLSELNISDNALGSSFLKTLASAFKEFKHLRVLRVTSTGMGSSGVGVLAKGLIHLTQLQELHFSDNQIGNQGAITLAGILKHLDSLLVIDVSRNEIEEKGATVFIDALKACTKMYEFNFSGNRNIGAGGISKLIGAIKSRTLHSLLINDLNLASHGAKYLARGLKHCFNLQRLSIASNGIGPDGFKSLFEALTFCRALRSLDISSNPLKVEGANALAGLFGRTVRLHELNFSNCDINTLGPVLGGLDNFTHLSKLDISGTHLTSSALSALLSSVNLADLSIQNCSIKPQGIKAIAGVLTDLCFLDISHNSIEDDGAIALAETLWKSTRLRTLYVNSDDIGTTGATALAAALQGCSSLTTLDITCNPIDTKGLEALQHSLKHCIRLLFTE